MIRLAIALLALAGVAAPASALAQQVAGSCRAVVYATSTLHDFEGTAPCARLEISGPDAKGHYRARVEVAVDQLDTGIGARNRRMREMFEAEHYPRITAKFADVDPDAVRAQRADALAFAIAIHGVERRVVPTLSDWSEVPGERARFRAAFELSLSEFGLEAPVAAGFVRVGDRVRVAVDVEVRLRGASS